jgi:hypothetical protein
MKKILMKKSVWIVVFIAIISIAVVTRRARVQRNSGWRDSSIAVGLSGVHRMSRPMSDRQRERFETHFMETPATPRVANSGALPPSASNAQAINAFNRKQAQ